jgi:hypothetical protein
MRYVCKHEPSQLNLSYFKRLKLGKDLTYENKGRRRENLFPHILHASRNVVCANSKRFLDPTKLLRQLLRLHKLTQ